MKLFLTLLLLATSTTFADNLRDLQSELADFSGRQQRVEDSMQKLRAEYKDLKKRDGCVGSICPIRNEDTPVRQRMQDIKNQLDQQASRLADLRKVSNEIKDDIRKEEKAIAEDRKAYERQQREERKRYEEQKAAQERAAREDQKARERQERADQKEHDRLVRAEEKEDNLHDRELENLRRKLQSMDVESSMSDLDYKTLSYQEELREIQRAYDNSLLGVYLQEKVGLLLNSDVICESITQCSGSSRRSGTIDGTKMKEIFPYGQLESTTRTGSQYRESTKGKQ